MTKDISVQLYSVRDQLAVDSLNTLERIAAIGYRNVEPFGLPQFGLLQQQLTQFSLSAPSAHGSVLDNTAAAISAAQSLGVGLLIEPYQPASRFVSRAAVEALAADLASAVEQAKLAGIRIGYHNHDHELASLIDGRPALMVLAELTPSELQFEVDLYWCQAAGVNAVEVVTQLGSRVAALHAKDAPLGGGVAEQLPAGQGAVPIAESRLAAPNALVVAEFDEYAGDIFEGLAQSFTYLSREV